MRKLLTGFILALTLLFSVGCIPTPHIGTGQIDRTVTLESIAQTIRAASLSIGIYSDTIILMHREGALDRATAEKLLDFALDADFIGLEASAFIRSLDTITPEDEQRLVKIVTPILRSIDTLIDETVIHIPGALAQERVTTLLFIIETVVTSLGGF